MIFVACVCGFLFLKRKAVIALFIYSGEITEALFSLSLTSVWITFSYIPIAFQFLEVWIVYFWLRPLVKTCSGASVCGKVWFLTSTAMLAEVHSTGLLALEKNKPRFHLWEE